MTEVHLGWDIILNTPVGDVPAGAHGWTCDYPQDFTVDDLAWLVHFPDYPPDIYVAQSKLDIDPAGNEGS